MQKINTVTLDAQTERKWVETRAALLWKAPAFTHILFSMLNPAKNGYAAMFSTDVPIAATDGSNLILNPDTFFKFSLDERVFIVAHEIMHCILNHCVVGFSMRKQGQVKYADGTKLPYDQTLMNIAMDLVINDLLISDRVGKFPDCGVHDTSLATKDDSFMDAYRKVFKQAQKNGGGGQGQGNGKGSGFDQHLDPGTSQGKDPAQASQDRSQTSWDTAVAAAIASAKAQGKLPAGLDRLLSNIVDPQVPWQEHIRAVFSRRVGGGSYDWRKPDRNFMLRDIYAPRRTGNGCGTVVVAVDTSGSIGQAELDVFFGEMRGILEECRPERIFVLWIDAKLHKVDEVDNAEDINSLKAHGGGGTCFKPAFEWIYEQGFQPDALVYMTDGYGSFPDAAPTYPVIWADISKRVQYPFGDVVQVDIK